MFELNDKISLMIRTRRRIGQPEEAAPLIVFLASAESSYITGASFYADGGWLAN